MYLLTVKKLFYKASVFYTFKNNLTTSTEHGHNTRRLTYHLRIENWHDLFSSVQARKHKRALGRQGRTCQSSRQTRDHSTECLRATIDPSWTSRVGQCTFRETTTVTPRRRLPSERSGRVYLVEKMLTKASLKQRPGDSTACQIGWEQ